MVAAGVEEPIIWRGRRARAFIPYPLIDRDLAIDPRTAARAATAIADITHSAGRLPDDYAPLARLLLRAEGVASSFIEGVRASVVDVVLAETAAAATGGGPAAWVAANLAAVTEAIAHAAGTAPATEELLLSWHRTLMTGSPTPARFVGALRTEQGWIGGTSPFDAHLVTPPPQYLAGLMADLVGYLNRTDMDPICQAAIAHAQFEVLHPFADGNGRVGRVLVGWVLTRRLGLLAPPPVSTAIASDVGGYSAGLTQFRLGEHGAWIRWFAQAVSGAGQAQQSLIGAVEVMAQSWERALRARDGRSLRSDATAWRVLGLLPRHLVLTSGLGRPTRRHQQGGSGCAQDTGRRGHPARARDRSALRPRPARAAVRQRRAARAGRLEPAALSRRPRAAPAVSDRSLRSCCQAGFMSTNRL